MTQSQKLTTDSYDQQLRFREDLVNQHYTDFLNYAYHITKDPHLARDLVQQSLFRFFKINKDQEITEILEAKKYLIRTIRNQMLKEKKARNSLNVIPFEEKHEQALCQKDHYPALGEGKTSPSCPLAYHANSAPNRTTTRKKKIAAIMAAMETLPQKKRKIIQLHYLEGYSHKEIQKMLNMKATAECQACRIAKLKMKEKIFLNSHLSS